ncbi:hypothetical protein KAZ01_00970, partial [Candidatus Gracilibacteria bacterium]|nr:hypothetical protein [Candidatus Gracilibacteria bacterium]
TLIEILVASLILGVTVFGILRLINNNMSQTNTLYKEKDKSAIFLNTKECVKSIGYDYFDTQKGTGISINFGSNNLGCFTGTYNDSLNFTGIILKSYIGDEETNGNEYWSYIIPSTGGINYLNITNYITDGINKKKLNFQLYK